MRHRMNYTPTHHQYGGGGGGGGVNRCCHSNHCVNRTSMDPTQQNGRLHKSLSFAFQTPMMWNEDYRTYHGIPSYATVGRSRSR